MISAVIRIPFYSSSLAYYPKRSHDISVFVFIHDGPPLCIESRLLKPTRAPLKEIHVDGHGEVAYMAHQPSVIRNLTSSYTAELTLIHFPSPIPTFFPQHNPSTMSISFRVVEHPSDPSREIRLELAPSIETLKYGPVRDTCTIIDLSKHDIEKLLDMTERAMNMPCVMMGQSTLGITKMVIMYVAVPLRLMYSLEFTEGN
jgi:hypothetical protein